MCIIGDLVDINYCDIGGQNGIYFVNSSRDIQLNGQINVAELLNSMDPLICSSTAHSFNRASAIFFQGIIDLLLYGMGISLNLPAMVRLSLI
jgi:hypothetical protein